MNKQAAIAKMKSIVELRATELSASGKKRAAETLSAQWASTIARAEAQLPESFFETLSNDLEGHAFLAEIAGELS